MADWVIYTHPDNESQADALKAEWERLLPGVTLEIEVDPFVPKGQVFALSPSSTERFDAGEWM